MMRRMVNLLAGASLVLLALTVALWVRSYWVSDTFWSIEPHDVGSIRRLWFKTVASGRGGLGIEWNAEVYDLSLGRAPPVEPQRWGWMHERPATYPFPLWRPRDSTRLGFYFAWRTSPDTMMRELIVPYWAVTLPLAVLPALRATAWRRGRGRAERLRLGLCPRCGYDLRASGGRCPECGTPVDSSGVKEAR